MSEQKAAKPVDDSWKAHAVTNTNWSTPNNTVALHALTMPQPSNTSSRHSGGTANVLPSERAKATFNVEKMTNVLDGGEEATKRRRWIISPTEGMDVSAKYNWDRSEGLKEHVRHFIATHEEFWESFIPTREDVGYMSDNTMLSGSLMAHMGLFLTTILNMADPDQQERWLMRAISMKIVGCYAQTELGHGSNVRGLQTTATYDKTRQEFIVDTPTLLAMKWWPSGQGKLATHAVVYAQLILEGKEHGVHVFMVQLRDENHRPLPGIELGDLGNKMGDHWNDTGFIRFNQVRIPRTDMLSRHQHVTPDGRYVKEQMKQNDKVHYTTMMWTRGSMVKMAGGQLARAATVAVRYSCVRRQGFENNATDTFSAPERQIIDWQVQRYRLLKQLATAYAFRFTGNWMSGTMTAVDINSSAVQEVAATSAGLKALCTVLAAQGIEDCRRCCGGNGYLLNSGVAAQSADYVWTTTAEGDAIVMLLQTARYLIKCVRNVRQGQPAVAPLDYLAPLTNTPIDADFSTFLPAAATSIDQLTELPYLLSLFRYRALVELTSVTANLDRKVQQGVSADEAWNSYASQLCSAVYAHCHYFILSVFAQCVDTVKDEAVGKALKRLCVVYALTNICDDPWTGLLSRSLLNMAREAVVKIMQELRPDAVSLVDAFEFPDRVLCSTLGRFDGNVYEALYGAALQSPLNRSDPFFGYQVMRPHLDMPFIKEEADKARLRSRL